MNQRARLPPPAVQDRPLNDDGRNIAPSLGALCGEGAQQRVDVARAQRVTEVSLRDSTSDRQTYYGLPLLQPLVWKSSIPVYFYVGGLAGASCALGAAAQFRGRRLRRLVRRTRYIGAAGAAISAALLIEDLGVRSRFVNMLRVFRPTSPMNLGTWILTAFGGAASGAALLGGRSGALGVLGEACGAAAGIFGLPLAGYTGVLVGNTSIPVWQLARTSLPPLFIASAISSAASAQELLPLTRAEERVARRYAIAGKAVELATALWVDLEVGRVPRAARPLRSGLPALSWHGAKLATAASLLLTLLPGRSRRRNLAAGILGTAGAVATRLSLVHAGRRSAMDAKASFAQQRQGLGAAEIRSP
jgi:formate-dependent nitrite reductase membrane component NrfD